MDYKQLLEPIEGDKPSGRYLKGERAQYRALRNTFNAAQSSFRRFSETPDSSNDEELFDENQKNWQAVSDACWQTLNDESKDIEIYCWWVMSLAFQSDSINKVATSLATLTPFIETFWPGINPYLPDNKLKSSEIQEQASERAELQLKSLVQLLGESNGSGLLYMPLQMLALVGDITLTKYLSATKAGTLPALKSKAQKDFSSYKADITTSIKALDLAIQSIDSLELWLKSKMTELSFSAISTQFLKTNLSDCLQAIKYLVEECFPHWPLDQIPEPKEVDVQVDTQIETPVEKNSSANIDDNINTEISQQTATSDRKIAVAESPVIAAGKQPMNRDSAFLQLRNIAEYFSKNEPHSPVSYLLEKAIRWGYMSLPDLMQELVSGNDKVLEQINLVTGISGDKAELPASKLTAPMSYNNSTDAKVSVINDTVSDSKSTTKALMPVDGEVSPRNTVSAPEGAEKNGNTEFSW
ncbi:MAG: type VI secretion system ImpA family N-terminal domain-containing protein [Colwellia sp.]|nr:type VI secretion system ImpA family N-terminal domain-containing protein [Colwellia sp.]